MAQAQLTKVQQRVVSKIASGAALNYINGGGGGGLWTAPRFITAR